MSLTTVILSFLNGDRWVKTFLHGDFLLFTPAMFYFCSSNGSIVVEFTIDMQTSHNLTEEDFLQLLDKSGKAKGEHIKLGALKIFSNSTTVTELQTLEQQQQQIVPTETGILICYDFFFFFTIT